MPSSCSFVCCDLTTGGTSQRYFTPGSYPPGMGMPYYPPVSLYPTPDQFHRRGVIPGSNSDGPAPYLLPPNAHPPPVVVVPHGSSPIRSPESPEPSRKPVVIPSPVILRTPQPQWQTVDIQTLSPPHEGSPIRPPRAQRSRSRSRRQSSWRRSPRERSPRTRPRRERSPPGQRVVDSDADSYSPPSPHLHRRPVGQRAPSITDFPQRSPSRPPVPPLSPRWPEIDEAPQLNVSTTLARPASSVQPNPNPAREPLPPAQRPVDSDVDSYSPPSPHLQMKALAAETVLITHFPPRRPSTPPVPPLPPRRPEIDEAPQLNVSAILIRTTSSVQSNPNSPRAPSPPAPRPVGSDADSYSASSPHLRVKALARRPASSTDFPQNSPPGSPRKPAADEEPQLNVSTTLARPTSSTQRNPNSPRAPPPRVQRPVDSDADSYSAPSPHFRGRALAEREAPSTDSSQRSPSGSSRMPAADEEPQLNVSTTLAPRSQP